MGRFATLAPPKNRFSKEVLEDTRFSQEALDVQVQVPEFEELPADPSGPPKGFAEERGPEEVNVLGDIIDDIKTVGQAAKIIINQPIQKGEIQTRLKNMITRAVSPLALIMPGVSRRGLIQELDEEAETFTGFGPALVPAGGQAAELATEWAAFQQLFGLTHRGFTALGKIQRVKKLGEAIKSFKSVNAFAERFPRIYAANRDLLRAFAEGETLGQTIGLLEGLDEGETAGNILKIMNIRGAQLGVIAGGFSLASSIDTALYVRRFRIALIKNVGARTDAKIKKLPKGKADPGARALIIQENLELQQIDNIVAGVEAELIGLKEGKLFREGQAAVESPQVAAKRIAEKGIDFSKPAIKGPEALKKQLGRTPKKPLLPTTRAGEIRAKAGEIAKAITQPVKTAQKAVAREGKPVAFQPPTAPPVAERPVKGVIIPPKPIQAKPEAKKAPEVAPVAEGKVIPKELEPLAEEARKFKTVDEFVKSQKRAFHGSPIEGLKEVGFGEGVRSNTFLGGTKRVKSGAIFFTPDKEVARFFAKNRVEFLESIGQTGKPVVYERFLNIKNPADLTDVKKADAILEKLGISAERELAGIEPETGLGATLEDLIDVGSVEISDLWRLFDDKDIVAKFKKAGFDGALLKETGDRGMSYAIFNPNQAFTKQQLTDFYNQVAPTPSALERKPAAEGKVFFRGDIEGRTKGLINLTESKAAAASFVMGGLLTTEEAFEKAVESGRLAEAEAQVKAFIPTIEKTLVIEDDGLNILSKLKDNGNIQAKKIIEDAKMRLERGTGTLFWWRNTQQHTQEAWEKVLIPQLQELGFDSIEYQDDVNIGRTLAVFDISQLQEVETDVSGKLIITPRPTPEQVKEAKLLIQRISIVQKKKGLTKREFSDLKLKHGGSRRLTGTRPRTIEQLQAVLKAIQKTRPKIVGHQKVVSRKTEKQIAELRTNLTNLGFMNDAEFQKVLDKEARGKEAKFVDAKNFITQKEGREILNRMHDTAQRLRVTEPIRRAVGKDFQIKKEIVKIEKLPTKAKDPSRLKSMRFVFQRLGEQANEPIYEVFLDLTLESQLRSRERHKSMKLAEKLPDFAKIANDPEALQRVEDWIVSQSVLFGRPEMPEDITDNELRLAKLIQASFKSYETLARAGKFFEFFDNRAELPQYLKFKQGIDKAFDIYNTKGYDALIEYLDTQDWGIVSAGYSPMESVVRKVSTHRMPDIAVGKTRIRQRGITYRKQDRDILQRWYSYMRQMDQLVHIQPRIKSLVRLINDNQSSFVNPQRISNIVSTYLDNLKHTNYEDGLIEEWSRRLYSQAITIRVLADPLKPLRNLVQNIAFSEDRRDFLDPRNKKLTAEDLEYLETHVQQASVMMTDWAFVGEDPILFKRLIKWVQRKTLYPSSDRLNRTISFFAKINRVRRAFAKQQLLAEKMKAARFSDMQRSEQKTALSILAKDGVDAMARYVAKVHTDNTHFLYAREQRSPAEQTKLGRIALNLALFRRAALEKALLQLIKVFQRRTGFGAKRRAASVLVTLLGMSALVGVLWKKMTGQRYSPYSYFSFLELNFGGLELATIEKAEDVYNSMFAIFTADPEKRGKAIEAFGTNITKAADYMIPFYDLGLRAIEATIGSENIDRIPARKLRELIDKEYRSRGLRQIDRSLIEKIQFTFAKGGKKRLITNKGRKPGKFTFGE